MFKHFFKKEFDLNTNEFYSFRVISEITKLTTTNSQDTENPIPGNNGELSISKISDSSITFSWEEGSDNKTSSDKLNYTIYYSTLDNIQTDDEIKRNGIKVEKKNNISSYSLSNLARSTQYYFNIFIEDESGNTAAYKSTSTKTFFNKENKIFIFLGKISNGNLGGRAGIDASCQTIYETTYINNFQFNNVRGLISINTDDEIQDIPVNYNLPEDLPIYGISNNDNLTTTIFAENFPAILNINGYTSDPRLINNLSTALNVSSITTYWTGSDYFGGLYNGSHCNNFTDEGSSIYGYLGEASDFDG